VPVRKHIKTPFIICVCCLLVAFLALLFLKDLLAARGLLSCMRRAIPGATFAFRKLTVGFGSVTIRDFSIVQKEQGDRPRLEAQGSGVVVRVSPLGFFFDPFLAVKEADVRLEFIQWGEWTARGFHFQAVKHPSWPYLRIRAELKNCSSDKKEVKDVSILMLMNRKGILINDMQAEALGGRLKASGFVTTPRRLLAPEISSVVFYLKDIHLKDVMSLLGGSKDMDTSGVFTGKAILVMQESQLQTLRGELDSVSGGSFVIKDSSILGQGQGGGEDQNIVIENLKNYYYDIGKIELRNLGQDIRMDVVLQGKAGRRDLELFWHRERKER
jgi:hypothetical protein